MKIKAGKPYEELTTEEKALIVDFTEEEHTELKLKYGKRLKHVTVQVDEDERYDYLIVRPKKNILLSTGDSRSKMDMLSAAKALQAKGYDIFATRGTAVFLETNGVHATGLHWPDQDEQPNTLTYIKEKKIDLVVNIPKNLSKDELNNDYTIRRSAIDFNIPLITNARLASAFIEAFCTRLFFHVQPKFFCI